MVVRLEKFFGNSLFFLEAVNGKGVTLTRWEDFRVFNEVYSDMFYRKLKGPRDEAFFSKLQEYLDQVQGNDYQLRITNVFFDKGSVVVEDPDEGPSELESRGFFCSELIVKCYKELGIFKTSRSSKTFYPSELSSRTPNPLKLEAGYELGDDSLILVEELSECESARKTGLSERPSSAL